MEYIEGRNLKSLLTDKSKFSWDEMADLVAQIAEALDYAHRKGIIHRDIKPANIILTTDSKVKITDFGIAKVASSNLTTTGQFLGTPNYMSPEQVSGAPVDGRSDIFSLGVVLYELLTGRKPFQGDNLTAISYKIVHEDFTPPAELSSEIPPEFNPIVARAMAKDPWNRYQRGKDLALALYQLKAHMEEQKALQDLGTMVSAAENLPTLKLANLQELAAQGAPKERDTAVTPMAGSPAVTPPAMPPPPPPLTPAVPMPTPNPAAATWPVEPRGHDPELTAALTNMADEAEVPLEGSFENQEQLPPLPPQLTPPPASAGAAGAQEWKKLAKAEVNPKWFWRVVVGVGALVLVIIGLFALFARSASKPSVAPDAALEQEVRDTKQALGEGQKLFGEGKYVESLAKFRQVLARSPNNMEARKYAQMAENAVKSQQEEQDRQTQIASIAAAARTALDEGRPDEAKAKAEEALALDPANSQAQGVLTEADAKITEAKVAAEAAARKKGLRPTQVAKKKDAAPTPAASTRVAAAPVQGPAAAPVPGNASVRLVFDSPINEGHVMVAVNDQILLRRPFSFKKSESHSVLGSFTVPSGPATIKAWLSGPDLPAAAFATTNGADLRR